ncbi:hypothetical protein A176_001290 [Myxococcus hansupus]|uniref:Lipoprotein n=1 Tax=Pseudomyxococcus hansupus TaxID=1297742 RepID=A0A0H4WS23_9BACT|nr:hypothetical protein [Myxococcus hansupus]AKQ64378.1 hypothetical protein A176_001290 [Myxococcus hansupus]
MKRWSGLLVVAALCGVACDGKKSTDRPTRAQLRKTGAATVEVIPSEGQLPYCMLYTVSEKGVIRQLTLTRENRSIRCEANTPVAHTSFRVPYQEGKVRMYIFFSNERIPAGPVAQQLYELRGQERINAMDLRLPGQVFVETLEFAPEEAGTEVTGTVVDGTNGTGASVLSDGGTEGGNLGAMDDGS